MGQMHGLKRRLSPSAREDVKKLTAAERAAILMKTDPQYRRLIKRSVNEGIENVLSPTG
jgi:hypothetical protein